MKYCRVRFPSPGNAFTLIRGLENSREGRTFGTMPFCAHVLSLLSLPLLAITTAHGGQLRVQPERLELTGGNPTHGVLVTLLAEDGSQTDVTARAAFVSNAEAIARVDSKGACTATGDGETTLKISAEGVETVLPLKVTRAQETSVPSFKQDILPIFTKTGCNMGGCHGKLAGQNGFKISLRGYAPEWDYEALTQELNGRRINFAFPEESLLVQKPCGDLAHEGGVRFKRGSRLWQRVTDWIAARAPGPIKDEANAAELIVLPGDRSMKVGETQQLLVQAIYPDGTRRDVTWLAQFFSNDETTISVKPSGRAKSLRAGQGSVRVHFQGLVQVINLAIPYETQVDPAVFVAAQTAVDPPLFQKLQQLHIPPSDACDDATFLRRVFLDVIGLLPTSEEVRQFLADSRPDKRAQVLEQVLARPEYVDYWTLQLADLLQNRKERDHDVRGPKGVRAFHQWLRTQVAANRPWSEIARDLLLSQGGSGLQPAVGYFVTVVGEKNRVEESELPDSVAQSFLGTRIGCARCHNHPLERYTQDDFYHFAACFSKVRLERVSPEKGMTLLTTVSQEEKEQQKKIAELEAKVKEAREQSAARGEEGVKQLANANRELMEAKKRLSEIFSKPAGVNQPRTNQFMEARPLDRAVLPVEPGSDPRVPFVEWMLKSENFSGAMVNRLWKHFMGAGLVEPVDDLRASNPPSNAALWAVLNHEFKNHGFDIKQLIRLIVQSRAYQLASTTRPENQTETRFYSHNYARRLPAEVMLDAISQATAVPDAFPGAPVGLRAQQLADSSVSSYFLSLFGRSERVTACACERQGEVTLPQMLHIRNSEELDAKIKQAGGRLDLLLKNPDNKMVIEELYLNSVSRLPAEPEQQEIAAALARDPREAVLPDLFWALLNSKEFAFNH